MENSYILFIIVIIIFSLNRFIFLLFFSCFWCTQHNVHYARPDRDPKKPIETKREREKTTEESFRENMNKTYTRHHISFCDASRRKYMCFSLLFFFVYPRTLSTTWILCAYSVVAITRIWPYALQRCKIFAIYTHSRSKHSPPHLLIFCAKYYLSNFHHSSLSFASFMRFTWRCMTACICVCLCMRHNGRV